VAFSAVLPPVHQGQLRVNTLPPEEVIQFSDRDGVFRGEVFAGIPLELEAVPASGWQFSHWEGLAGDPANSLVTVVPEGPLEVRAVFTEAP
jgi:hypothetical protein